MDKFFIAGTPVIGIPSKMVYYDKKGNLKETPTLTKKRQLTVRNKKPVIIFEQNDRPDFPVKVYHRGQTKYLNDLEAEEKMLRESIESNNNDVRYLLRELDLIKGRDKKAMDKRKKIKTSIESINEETEKIRERYKNIKHYLFYN